MDSVLIAAGETEQYLRQQAGSVTLIRRHELDRDNQLSLAPALNRVPGVQMQQGAFNTARISIRGIGARSLFSTTKVRAYFEDIPLTDGEGGTSLEDLDMSTIERVEIMRGPTSSIYGTGLAGTIRISARQLGWEGQEAQVGLQVGAFGSQRMTGRYQVADDQMSLQLIVHDSRADGFRQNSQYQRTGFTSTATWASGSKSTLTWIGQWSRVKALIPSSIDSLAFVTDPSQAAFTWLRTRGFESYDRAFTGLSWRYRYHANLEHVISVFGGFRDADEPRPFDILRENSMQQGVRARWIFRQTRWRGTAGLEAFREGYLWKTYENIAGLGDRGPILSDNQEYRRYANFFVQGRGDLRRFLSWEAGANLNVTHYDYEDFFFLGSDNLSGNYTFAPTLSPRLALLWNKPNWTTRLQLSHGFSPPTLSETLTPSGQINPDIQPEKGWNLEAGWRGTLIREHLWLDATLYRMWVSDLLVARRVGNDQFVGVNAGQSIHDGLELALQTRITEAVTLWVNYTEQRFRFTDFVSEGVDYQGNAVTGVPARQSSAGVDVEPFPRCTVRVSSQYVSAIPLRDDNSIYSEEYFLLQARMDYGFELAAAKLSVYGGVNNLTNVNYASMVLVNAGSFGGAQPRYYYPGNPREWYLGISLAVSRPARGMPGP